MSKKKKPVAEKYSNSSTLLFPTDKFGLTTELKKVGINLASRINGDPEKMELFEETLAMLKLHIDARYKEARAVRGLD